MDVVLVIILLIVIGVLMDGIFGDGPEWSIGSWILSVVLVLFLAGLILDIYIGNEIIEGKVFAVSKLDIDAKVTTEFSDKPSVSIEPSNSILKAYEVAVYPNRGSRLIILKNENNLWLFKFDKRDIQLQINADKEYRFLVHRVLWFRGNILDVQEK